MSQSGNKNPRWKALKIFLWVIGVLIVIAVGCLWGLSVYLSPQRIASIIEKEASKYLDADLSIAKIDYSLFSSYPWLDFQIDSLTIVSKSLEGLSAETLGRLPANSDRLAEIARIKGKINLKKLLKEKIVVRDISIESPEINIVIADSTTNNFSIFPHTSKKLKMPDFSLSELQVTPPVAISFFSLPDSAQFKTDIERLSLIQTDKKHKTYTLTTEATIDGKYKNYALPGPVPFDLMATARFNLMKLILELDELQMKIADISFNLSGEMVAGLNKAEVNSLIFSLSVPDLFSSLSLLPQPLAEQINLPAHISGYIPFQLKIELLEPYLLNYDIIKPFSLNQLPQLSAQVNINRGNLHFTPPGLKPIQGEDIRADIYCYFNPLDTDSTYLRVNNISMQGEGLEMDLSAYLSNPLGEQQNISADLKFDSKVMRTLSYLLPKNTFKVNGHLKGDLSFTALATALGKEGLKNITVKTDLKSKSLEILPGVSSPDISLTDLDVIGDISFPKFPFAGNYQGSDISMDISASGMAVKSGKTNSVDLKGFQFGLNVEEPESDNPSPDGVIKMKAASLDAVQNDAVVHITGIDFDGKGRLLNTPQPSAPAFELAGNTDDNLIAQAVAHTPLYLQSQGGGMIQTMMNLIALNADVKIAKGEAVIPSYLYPFRFSGLNLSTDLERVSMNASNVKIGKTSFSLTGEASGIRSFITSYSPTLLKADADINFSNVDINQLSWGYYGALQKNGVDSIYAISPLKPYTASDSSCVVIPRNIDANIRLKSQKAEYMSYQFSPLATSIIIKDGNATLNQLTIGTPYCKVAVDWTYSTQNLDNIFMQLNADINRFDFKPFYAAFPQVVAKAKELENFSGEISASIDCHFRMFPTMFMEAPSLRAKYDIRGTNLEFARSGKIEKLTHLLLIEGDEPIKISNLDITGGFHDNLLQLNPFKIRFDDYQIGVAGVNNMQGKIYYHIALEKSPFHLPFGVSLEGELKHPEIRVGGTGLDDSKGEKLSMDLEWNPDVNIMASLKHGWLLFLQEAARYQQNKDGEE